jgi:hypothetical protein
MISNTFLYHKIYNETEGMSLSSSKKWIWTPILFAFDECTGCLLHKEKITFFSGRLFYQVGSHRWSFYDERTLYINYQHRLNLIEE